MQIVINISDRKWKSIQEGMYCGLLDTEMYDAIKQGTPLPEHHGKLVSYNDVDNVIYDYSYGCDVNYGQIMEYIEKIPTILEATEDHENE